MFHGAPGFRVAAFKLRLAAAHDLRFLGRQGVAGIPFRKNGNDATAHLEFELVPALETRQPANGGRDDNRHFAFDGNGHVDTTVDVRPCSQCRATGGARQCRG